VQRLKFAELRREPQSKSELADLY